MSIAHVAAALDHIPLLRFLLNHHRTKHPTLAFDAAFALTSDGASVLDMAAQFGSINAVKYLVIEAKCAICSNAVGGLHTTQRQLAAPIWAIVSRQHDTTCLLLEYWVLQQGSEEVIRWADMDGDTLFHWHARAGYGPLLAALASLNTAKAAIANMCFVQPNRRGECAFEIAALNGNVRVMVEMIMFVLQDLDLAKSVWTDMAPKNLLSIVLDVMDSSAVGLEVLLQVLHVALQAVPELAATLDNEGVSPLGVLVRRYDLVRSDSTTDATFMIFLNQVAQLLVTCPLTDLMVGYGRQSPLLRAARIGFASPFAELSSHSRAHSSLRQVWSARGKRGRSILHEACAASQWDLLLDILLPQCCILFDVNATSPHKDDVSSLSAIINAVDREGNTALHLVAAHGHGPAARALLRHGALVTVRNSLGYDPCALALLTGHSDLARQMLSWNDVTRQFEANLDTQRVFALAAELAVQQLDRPLPSTSSHADVRPDVEQLPFAEVEDVPSVLVDDLSSEGACEAALSLCDDAVDAMLGRVDELLELREEIVRIKSLLPKVVSAQQRNAELTKMMNVDKDRSERTRKQLEKGPPLWAVDESPRRDIGDRNVVEESPPHERSDRRRSATKQDRVMADRMEGFFSPRSEITVPSGGSQYSDSVVGAFELNDST
jgi:ankyrin repeat protein